VDIVVRNVANPRLIAPYRTQKSPYPLPYVEDKDKMRDPSPFFANSAVDSPDFLRAVT
jgi:hypothetical protein